jgi:streptogramin lyase
MRVVLLLVAALAAAAIATAGNPPDPRQTRVVETGSGPCGIAVEAGSIWVGVYGTGKVLQIDAATGRVRTRIDVGPWACRIAVGTDSIWVTRDRPGELVRVSRATGRTRRMPVGRGAFDVLLAGGSIWTTSYDTGAIVRVDPVRHRMTRVYKDGIRPAGLAWCNGRIWVGHGETATWLTRIDPASNAMRRVDVRTTNPGWPHCSHGALWIPASETLLKVSAATGKVLARTRLGGTLAAAADGPDALIWVTDKERSLVHRVYAEEAGVTDTFDAGPGAFALARVGDAMWITSFAGSDIRRYER